MQLGDPGSKKSKQIIRGIIITLILLSIIVFRDQFPLLFGLPLSESAAANVAPTSAFLFFNCLIGFFFVFFLWGGIISFQTLLPITDFLQKPSLSMLEAYRTSWHLLLHILGLHGPAIAVINGKDNSTLEDQHRIGYPGVIVIDYNSAVVLEERLAAPGVNMLLSIVLAFIQRTLFLADSAESPRVRGPGIVFTHPRERIRGVVDLRKQFRVQPKIRCYTREGIELYSNIFAGFTIGQAPDILQVVYVGEPIAENLRVISLETRQENYLRVTGFTDDLDAEDRAEIHAFAMRAGQLQMADRPVFAPYSPLPNTSTQAFNPERVFAAAYAQARNAEQKILPWDQLPTQVAAGIYRELLMQVNYDDLYDVRERQTSFPLPDYKTKLRLAMRNNGILAFRLVQHVKGEPFVQGHIYRAEDVFVSQPRALTNSKILRDRGIKVLFSSFGDLFPVNEEVYQQRFNTWRASWESELNIKYANHELEAMRVHSRAYIQAQQELWRSLQQLFEPNAYTDEALALRILQAMDQAAADPRTRSLLPSNTMDMMRYLHSLLLPPETPNPQPAGAPTGGGPP